MRVVKGVAVVLALLVGLALVADRIAVALAEEQVADAIAEGGELPGAPDVSIGGWPFLTQALTGNYSDVSIRLTAADLGEPEGTSADVRLRGVRVPLSDVLGGAVTAIPVDRVDGVVSLSYALLSRELGTDTTLVREGAGLRLTTTVQVLGYEVPLTAVGTVTLEGQELVIAVDGAAAAGVELPDRVVEAAGALLDLRYPIELPFGLELTAVTPADDGVLVTARARDTVLSAG